MSGEKKKLRVALAGNPNSGKSTLFNALTGLNQKTGNFPGVTVDKKTGQATLQHPLTKKIHEIDFIDLPGTYSLYPKSLDEKVSFEILTDPQNKNYPDITIIVADASNLKRNLLLASQIIDLQRPVVVALNMIDVAEELGYKINGAVLESQLGVPVVVLNSRRKKGVDQLREKIFGACISNKNLKTPVEKISKEILAEINSAFPSSSLFASILRMAEDFPRKNSKKNEALREKAGGQKFFAEFEKNDNLERFKRINEVWEKCVTKTEIISAKTRSEKIDAVLTHRFFGVLIFLCILFLIFQCIFFLADFPMQWIEIGFGKLQTWTKEALPKGMLNDLLTDGVLAGLSGIVVFVPQIALLFGFLAVLEDTGYMARVSFIMDKMMRGFGLNGRSVIPLMSGVACAVPAIMSARTISNAKERLITILVTPLMSCSARLPVYTLLIGLMVPQNETAGFFNEKGLWMMGLYLLGFAAAILVALVFKFVLRTKEKSFFILELPVYRKPQLLTVLRTIFEKVKVFLWDAGRVIMVISIILWFLTAYGPGDSMQKIKLSAQQQRILALQNNSPKNTDEINRAEKTLLLESSYAGHLGKFIEPAIRPLGFDWKIGISLITSFAAREVFVGTMATIYSSGDETETSVREKLENETDPQTGKKKYSRAVCMSLLIFYVFAMQCMSTLAVVRRETKTWKWPLVQFIFMGVMAYFGSWMVFNFFN